MIERQSRNRVYLIGLGLVAAAVIVLWQGSGQRFGLALLQQKMTAMRALPEQPKSTIAIAPLQVEQKMESLPSASPSSPVKDEVTILNDKGVDLVLKKQYWPAIFLFKQAMELDQKRIEPVVNMAVTLNELGLSRPSARYLAMAETMNPGYAPLRINRKTGRGQIHGVDSTQKTGLLDDQIH